MWGNLPQLGEEHGRVLLPGLVILVVAVALVVFALAEGDAGDLKLHVSRARLYHRQEVETLQKPSRNTLQTRDDVGHSP